MMKNGFGTEAPSYSLKLFGRVGTQKTCSYGSSSSIAVFYLWWSLQVAREPEAGLMAGDRGGGEAAEGDGRYARRRKKIRGGEREWDGKKRNGK
jgi:hypothetical protein